MLDENAGLFEDKSPAMLMLMLIHWLWVEYTRNFAEVMVAPAGIVTFVKRIPV